MQHPNGRPKTELQAVAFYIDENGFCVRYDADTNWGSSGSPIIALNRTVVGVSQQKSVHQQDRRHSPVHPGVTVYSFLPQLELKETADACITGHIDVAKALSLAVEIGSADIFHCTMTRIQALSATERPNAVELVMDSFYTIVSKKELILVPATLDLFMAVVGDRAQRHPSFITRAVTNYLDVFLNLYSSSVFRTKVCDSAPALETLFSIYVRAGQTRSSVAGCQSVPDLLACPGIQASTVAHSIVVLVYQQHLGSHLLSAISKALDKLSANETLQLMGLNFIKSILNSWKSKSLPAINRFDSRVAATLLRIGHDVSHSDASDVFDCLRILGMPAADKLVPVLLQRLGRTQHVVQSDIEPLSDLVHFDSTTKDIIIANPTGVQIIAKVLTSPTPQPLMDKTMAAFVLSEVLVEIASWHVRRASPRSRQCSRHSCGGGGPSLSAH